MSITLSQRMEAIKSDWFRRRMDASIKYHAGRIIKNIQPIAALPDYAASGVTDAQVVTWATRTQDGDGMAIRMLASFLDDVAMDAIFADLMNPALSSDAHDATVNGITIYSIVWYALLD